MGELNNENAYATIEAGETYRFAGYSWTACEVNSKRHTAVLQSHGVTSGAWPGYVIPQFGNGNFYAADIDGEDISSYDDKMQALYNAIKDVEDTSASYGKGLYLIPKEKAGFTKCEEPGSGNYWKTLKTAAGNARSFWTVGYGAWLGTADGSGALYVSSYASSDGYVYSNYGLDNDFVVAPAFNLDLSKVKIVGGEIITKPQAASSSFIQI